MQQFQAYPKKWGNSMGVTLPSSIVNAENITPKKKITVLILTDDQVQLRKLFGTLEFKKTTPEMMKEIDEGYDRP